MVYKRKINKDFTVQNNNEIQKITQFFLSMAKLSLLYVDEGGFSNTKRVQSFVIILNFNIRLPRNIILQSISKESTMVFSIVLPWILILSRLLFIQLKAQYTRKCVISVVCVKTGNGMQSNTTMPIKVYLMAILENYMFRSLLAILRLSSRELKVVL